MYEKDYKGTICLVPQGYEERFFSEGGFFDKEHHVFVFPDNKAIEEYDHWFPKNSNIICNFGHYILESQITCWKCKKPTTVIVLASESFDYKIPQTRKGYRWEEGCNGRYKFSHIKFMPFFILNQIKKRYPCFKYVYSFIHKFNYFANTCEHCGIIQEDKYLHQLTNSVFYENSSYVTHPRVYLETIEYRPAFGFLMEAEMTQIEKMGFLDRGGEPFFWFDGFMAPLTKDKNGTLWYYDSNYHYYKD